ncbi:MAG: response regulator [Deltaproteobacteria bacterium]|nr:response regulator [Deltaproteobacteria bacterium]
MLSRYLERQGHTVQVAHNGRKALEIIATSTFDLVLLDTTMPEMSGIELKQELPVQFTVVDWKHTGKLGHRGAITKIAHNMVEIHSEVLPSSLANLRICLYDPCDHEITDDLYGKVVAHLSESPLPCCVHFTSVPPEAEAFLSKFLGAVL